MWCIYEIYIIIYTLSIIKIIYIYIYTNNEKS